MTGMELPLFVIDFEGNGETGIVEYGIVEVRGWAVAGCHTRLCRGRRDVPVEETWIHGIRNADTHGLAPVEGDYALFQGLRRQGVFGAHHAIVEDSMIRRVWPYPGVVPDPLAAHGTTVQWGPWVDTRRVFEHLFPEQETHQLMDLIRLLALQDELEAEARRWCPPNRRKAHCALYDALASALLVRQVRRFPGFEEADLTWMARLSLGADARHRQDQGELFDGPHLERPRFPE